MPQKPRLCRFQSLGPHGFHQVAYIPNGATHNDRIVVYVHECGGESIEIGAIASVTVTVPRQ
jgi:hypothetical protein